MNDEETTEETPPDLGVEVTEIVETDESLS